MKSNFVKLFIVFISFTFSFPFSIYAIEKKDSLLVNDIIIIGNKKTKPSIILRELTFSKNEYVYEIDSILLKCKENLSNTSLFNFVEINYIKQDSNSILVYINVTERWYLWPMPVFELADRNFNEWAEKKDFSRTNYGIYVRQDNFRGRNEVLQFQFINGYTRRLGINYTVPYINRKQNIGLSAGIFFSRNHEITYDTKNNKLLFFKDQDRFPRNDFSTYVSINKRKGIYQYFFTSVEYRRNITLDTVLSLNPDFFINQSTTQQGLSISWKYRFDKRDYKPYPMRGVYFEFDVFRSGFATMKNEPDLTSFSAGIRKYVKLNEKFNFSGMLKARITQLSKAPFYNQKAIGYGQDYIRGYDYYVINGQNFFLIKSQFKYTLMKNRVYKMGLIKTEKFNKIPIAMYLNAFGDGGYVSDRFYNATNTLTNSFQYSYGVGFDYVTYYDLVFRVEYAINRLNERGFFFRVGASF